MSHHSEDRARSRAATGARGVARLRSNRVLRRGGLGGAAALACAVVCGASAAGAFAAAGTTVPASSLGTIGLGAGPLPSGGSGVKISGTCPEWLFRDPAGFTFTSGHGVLYQPDSSGIPGSLGLPPFDGANVEGNATLSDVVDGMQVSYTGQAHLWYGLSYSPVGNQQFYFGQTVMFKGTGPAGSLSLNANPGFVTSASGHQSSWGQLNLSCS